MGYLNSSTSSEEQQVTESRIEKMPKFICNERAFFNDHKKTVDQTYTYIYEGSDCKISLPEIPNDNPIISSLLFIRKLVLRIGVLYKYKAMTTMMFGSGVLITNKLVLTSGHIFDPIDWNAEKVSYSNIFIAFSDPAPETAFSLLNPDKSIFAAKVIRRGLLQDKINDHTQYDNNLTDLALLALDNAAEITTAEYFQPTLNQKSSTTLNVPLNSKLYLIGYNGELLTNDELKPYRHLHEFANLNIDKLNLYHHINYKSI
ncbi:hypothetical protein I4U23_021681 [Adineta vaga]|nr:hypothetical protein I4U23_021681 [Adineta vaga]